MWEDGVGVWWERGGEGSVVSRNPIELGILVGLLLEVMYVA